MKLVPYLLTSALVLLVTTTEGGANSKDGPRRWTRTLKGNSEVVYKIEFLKEDQPQRRLAEFAVIGDGSTDVDVFVYDEAGKEVARDDKFSDLALVRWLPTHAQRYTIKVKNLGADDNVCTMGHN
jgi:hypothetical protein